MYLCLFKEKSAPSGGWGKLMLFCAVDIRPLVANLGGTKNGAQLYFECKSHRRLLGCFVAAQDPPLWVLCSEGHGTAAPQHPEGTAQAGVTDFGQTPLCCGTDCSKWWDWPLYQLISLGEKRKLVFWMFQVGLWTYLSLPGKINLPTEKQITLQTFEKDGKTTAVNDKHKLSTLSWANLDELDALHCVLWFIFLN